MRKKKTTNIYVGNQRIQIQKKHGFFSYFKTHILMSLLGISLLGIVTSALIIDYQMVLMVIKKYTPVTITMIYAVNIAFINVEWLRNHLYIPLTHDELVSNQIESCEQYKKVITNMFYYKPLKRAIDDVEHTAKKEFKKEICCYYQEERFVQVIPIVYVLSFMIVFICSLFKPVGLNFISLQWGMTIIYWMCYLGVHLFN